MATEQLIKCDRCNRLYRSLAVAQCNHPAVNQYHGKHICMYCCAKCKHHIRHTIGIGCELKK